MPKSNELVGRLLYAGAIVTLSSIVTYFTWNIALTPMFASLPDLKFGNLFVVFAGIFFVKNLLASPVLGEISDRLAHLEKMFQTIHTNDVSQRKGMLEIMSIINNKLDGDKTDVQHGTEQ